MLCEVRGRWRLPVGTDRRLRAVALRQFIEILEAGNCRLPVISCPVAKTPQIRGSHRLCQVCGGFGLLGIWPRKWLS